MMGYFNLAELMPNENKLRNYFRYGGSLTSPPCTSGLIWTVFDHKIPISHNQVSLTLNLILNALYFVTLKWNFSNQLNFYDITYFKNFSPTR